ncbi:FMN-dependent NADH-azoreductase [Acidicapsa dinghuensis]|uniref:FMN dependent NADH:quinone oxidoreductase n=1 Tax=Acidicapsa dinghuensis TaxID=2218256 RepID=A0ABW1ELM7_9BACT|nr:NAD(P)H-dependent oxidoreductase [Acidicapsa dinghuensis]
MATLLHVDSSPLETSITRELGREFVKTWTAAHPDGEVIYRDLAATELKPLDASWIFSSFTPEGSRSAEQTATLAVSDELIRELEQADEYVIGVAMHNFTIPGTLKLWIDQVLRSGSTFSYGAAGPVGLLRGKKAVVLIATGGVYDAGSSMSTYNFVEPYLKTILGFIGVTDVKFLTAGGTAKLMTGAIDRETLLKPVLEQVRDAVIAA